MRFLLLLVFSSFALSVFPQTGKQKPVNIIFILADDHRYDAMGFMNKIQGLQTPGMDRMAREGMHIKMHLYQLPYAPQAGLLY